MESNHRHKDFQSFALPSELCHPAKRAQKYKDMCSYKNHLIAHSFVLLIMNRILLFFLAYVMWSGMQYQQENCELSSPMLSAEKVLSCQYQLFLSDTFREGPNECLFTDSEADDDSDFSEKTVKRLSGCSFNLIEYMGSFRCNKSTSRSKLTEGVMISGFNPVLCSLRV